MIVPTDLQELLFERWPVGRLATVRPDGTPHLVPIVFCSVDGILYSPLDAKRKSGRNLQRFANVSANPSVSVLLDEYDNDWSRLWWVRIDATADRFEPEAPEQGRIDGQLRDKYVQYRKLPAPPGAPVYLRMIPRKVVGWTQSGSVDLIADRLVYPGAPSG